MCSAQAVTLVIFDTLILLTIHMKKGKTQIIMRDFLFLWQPVGWLSLQTIYRAIDIQNYKYKIELIQKRIKLRCQQTEVYSLDIMVQTIR